MKGRAFFASFFAWFLATIAFGDPARAADGVGQKDNYQYTRRFEKVYEADPRAVFSLKTEFGDVLVKSWDQNKIGIVADIRAGARNKTQASEYGERIQIEVTQSTGTFSVKTFYPDRSSNLSNVSFSVDYTITLPARQSADLRNMFGSVSVSGMQGALTVNNRHGEMDIMQCSNVVRLENEFESIRLKEIGGKAITVENANGNVTGTTIAAGIQIRNRFGNVELEKVEGNMTVHNANGGVDVTGVKGTADVENQFGPIRLADVSGPVKIESRNGDVDVENSAGGKIRNTFGKVRVTNTTRGDVGLEIDNMNGDIAVGSVKGNATFSTSFSHLDALNVSGDVVVAAGNSSVRIDNPGGTVEVENSFGPVSVKGSQSDVRIRNQNGSIECVVLKAGRILRASSSFAPVKLYLPEGLSATFRVETSFGEIECEYPLKAMHSGNKTTLEGTVKEGTSSIEIISQNGNVRILKGAEKI